MFRNLLRFALLLAFAAGCPDDPVRGVDDAAMPMDGEMQDAEPDADVEGDAEVDAAEDSEPMMPDTGPVSCTNGIQDGDETDMDCGGERCNPCETDQGCAISSDCTSGVCIGNSCQPPRCGDGIMNGDETDVDCGQTACMRGCQLGQACDSMADCEAGTCTGGFCVASHCSDGVINAGETDLDCGGADCGPCMNGQACGNSDDNCMSPTGCIEGFCRTTECANGAMDGDEIGVDCGGGECPGCPDGTMCMMPTDCRSGRCETTCTSCADGVQNGDESDVDCGGSECRRCYGGEVCTDGPDCATGVCTSGICEGGGLYYDEDFSTGDGGWTAGGTSSSWAYGAPSSDIIDSARSGSMVWVTNPAGDYNSNEESQVESPTFDLSTATDDPLLEMWIWFETEPNFDEFWLEVSTDDGGTWTKVVDDGTAINWYNDLDNEWWEDTNGGWMKVSAILTGTAGSAMTKLRIRCSTDSSGERDGLAFDDIVVREDLCRNGIQDPGEADVDCGGECELCPDGAGCAMNADCFSGRCDTDTCGSCRDGQQNGDEVQIDCGGLDCGLCPGGTPCSDGAICASGMCTDNMCAVQEPFYIENFGSDDGGWTGTGSWEYAAPAGSVIDSAFTGSMVWITSAGGTYDSDEDSWVQSPAIDLSAATDDPEIAFVITTDLERFDENSTAWDVVTLEVSTDGGTTWRVVGDVEADGWYNGTNSDGQAGFADTRDWMPFARALTGTAGSADVRVRFRLLADGSTQQEGVAIDDVRIGPPVPDLGVSIAPSDELCSAGRITVTNFGSLEVSFFVLTTVVDGSSSMMRVTTPLMPGESWDTEVAVTTSLEATVSTPGDGNPDNDTAMGGGGVTPIPLGARYIETFENDDGGWQTTGTNSSWEWGQPDGTNARISSADSGRNAWVTSLDGDHNNGEVSYLVSPCFDMGMAMNPQLSFSYIHQLESTNDHVHVELSVDGGRTWNKLGTGLSGSNWYNDIAGDYWDGESLTWSRGGHPLDGAARASAVRLRLVMQSNEDTTDEGFGLDDVIIVPAP